MRTKIIALGLLFATVLIVWGFLLVIEPMKNERRAIVGYNGKNHFLGLVDGYCLWVISDRGWLTLDGVKWPSFRPTMNDDEKSLLMDPIKKRIREVFLENGTEFNFIWTNHDYAGPRQAGGVFLFRDGRTLQGILIKEGLVRYNRDWQHGRIIDERPGYKELNSNKEQKRSIDELKRHAPEWLKMDRAARRQKTGFWSKSADFLRYYWDDEDDKIDGNSK